MTQDEIIRMAREAGPLTKGPFDDWCKRFANLVAAHEREACAKVCSEVGANGLVEIKRFAALVAAAEREACAKLCDGLDDDLVDGLAGWQFGEAIRARGEQT